MVIDMLMSYLTHMIEKVIIKRISIPYLFGYSRVFSMQNIFLANENSNKGTCIHLQAKLSREASKNYTFRLRPRTPRIEKMHSFLQYSVSLRYIAGSSCWGAFNTSRAKRWPAVVLFVIFTKFTQSNSISNRSYTKSFYCLITHRLNYRRNN